MESKPGSATATTPRWLLALVVGMGILIVVGVVVIVVEIGRRLSTTPKAAVEGPAAAPRTGALAPRIDVPLPEGARIIATYAADQRLWAEVELADGTLAVWIVNPATGKVDSIVRFGAPPASTR